MNAPHSKNPGAVVTRLHDVALRSNEKSGAVSGRGCARGTGRQHTVHAERQPRVTVFDALQTGRGATGDPRNRDAYGETGDRPEQTERDDAEAAFTAYVRERRASLYATAYHLTGDRYEAEDLLQSALFSTYRAWHRISDKAAVGGYLRRTMTNLHISAWRRRKLNEYPTEELPETAGDTDAMRGTELRAVLWQALARLPELQRTMLVLRYYEGRTDPEIADILDISVGTVKSSIWRSLRRLRDDEVLSFGRDQEESFGELVA
ncbi:SigE family RNA polymerase sigma factor [Streptomyces sp. ZG43]|uniref:SigE family RNA polymerase sigma factor n=1 Tax=Streptomyces TaxID=1883 RepID=UPI0003C2B84F|nr:MULTISPECIES: SigE family RNA polymerase sigma factor [unclassified Streptomyces]ESP97889.1 RNA polymerase ECF-subfamily sigma factor [Streptomyces sp. GBA 94-10 4N24]RPK70383.1 RNA polymerase sigma-E factor [Streptomyces sp. ADI96-15]UZN61068.1 RNA polymerase ECF-subfamily sigma factor [Streptomyces sp. GBA 94-10 4N24]